MNESTGRNLRLLAGIAGALVGPLVLTFAFVGTSTGIAFAPEVGEGGSIEPWVETVRAHPAIWKLVMCCITLGFGSMFVSGFSSLQLLRGAGWPRYLSLCGYLIGIPVAISSFAAHASTMLQLELSPSPVPEAVLAHATVSMLDWLLVSTFFGPFFVVVLGTGGLAWCALKEGFLPRWVCSWGLACALMAFLHLFGGLVPVPAIFGLGAGPLHMLWFSVMGCALLLKRPA